MCVCVCACVCVCLSVCLSVCLFVWFRCVCIVDDFVCACRYLLLPTTQKKVPSQLLQRQIPFILYDPGIFLVIFSLLVHPSCDLFLGCVSKVMELTVGSQMGEELKIDKMVNKFFMELTKATKLPSTGKAEVYSFSLFTCGFSAFTSKLLLVLVKVIQDLYHRNLDKRQPWFDTTPLRRPFFVKSLFLCELIKWNPYQGLPFFSVPAGSPSCGGDVMVYVWHKLTDLAHSFLFCSCVCFCLYGPFSCISFR